MGAMYMIDTVTESLPMVEIFMPFPDVVCYGFERGLPLREIKTLSEGDNIITMRSK